MGIVCLVCLLQVTGDVLVIGASVDMLYARYLLNCVLIRATGDQVTPQGPEFTAHFKGGIGAVNVLFYTADCWRV